MNPVLLKPGSDRRVPRRRPRPAGRHAGGRRVRDRPDGTSPRRPSRRTRSSPPTHDVVVCEGAGSPAEINLRAGDYVNLGLARRFGLPVAVVGDIDRGGRARRPVRHGRPARRRGPGADPRVRDQQVPRRPEPCWRPGWPSSPGGPASRSPGVLPWLADVWLDAEDTLEVGALARPCARPRATLRVAVVRLPRVSNATDVDALAAEPGVEVLVTTDPEVVAGADLAVLPGHPVDGLRSRPGCGDRGLADAVADRARRRRPVLGICGGYQMLADDRWTDDVESGAGEVDGLGLLPVSDRGSAPRRCSGGPSGAWAGTRSTAYEIHHGRGRRVVGEPPSVPGRLAGRRGLGHDVARRVRERRVPPGLARPRSPAQRLAPGRPSPAAAGYGARREAMIDTLADAIEEHLDLDLLLGPVIRIGPRHDRPGPGGRHRQRRPRAPDRGGRRRAERVDVFLVADKGAAPARSGRAAGRAVRRGDRRTTATGSSRCPTPAPTDRDVRRLRAAVRDWHAARARRLRRASSPPRCGDGGTVGFLVWGDPAFYDSTIRRRRRELPAGVELDVRVDPRDQQRPAARGRGTGSCSTGSASPSTSPRGGGCWPSTTPDLGDVVVMLDGDLACAGLVPSIPTCRSSGAPSSGCPTRRWSAGRLADVSAEIRATREAIRIERGWVMDTYLLRQP